ncbi:MAG: hypothetical protein QXQ68_06015 [Candidatus Nitrosocaldaceae archaeon]
MTLEDIRRRIQARRASVATFGVRRGAIGTRSFSSLAANIRAKAMNVRDRIRGARVVAPPPPPPPPPPPSLTGQLTEAIEREREAVVVGESVGGFTFG